LEGNSDVLERLVTEMYARGMSTRDIEDAFRDVTGELLISKSAVSEITDRLWADYQQFIARDLSEVEVEYLFADAIFESLRAQGAKEALLVAWCIAADGRKHLLHLTVGNKESEACWTEFFRNLLGRGLRLPTGPGVDHRPGTPPAQAAAHRARAQHPTGRQRRQEPTPQKSSRMISRPPIYRMGRT
jgi:putative transposase